MGAGRGQRADQGAGGEWREGRESPGRTSAGLSTGGRQVPGSSGRLERLRESNTVRHKAGSSLNTNEFC